MTNTLLIRPDNLPRQVRRDRRARRRAVLANNATALTLVLAAGLAAAAIMSLFGHHWWLADLVANGRHYYLLAGIVGLLCALVSRRLLLLPLMLLALAPHLIALYSVPYAPRSPGLSIKAPALPDAHSADTALAAVASPSAQRLRLVTANLFVNNRDSKRIAQKLMALAPDIVVLQEVRPGFEKQIRRLRRHLLFRYPGAAPIRPQEGQTPRRQFQMNRPDIVILSRYPLTDGQVHYPGPPDRGNRPFPLVTVKVRLPQGQLLRLVGVHAGHPFPERLWPLHKAYLRAVAREGARAANARQRLIVAGDFNLTAWSRRFARMQRRGQLKLVGLPAFSTTWSSNGGQGWQSLVARAPIDHVLVSRGIQVRKAAIGPDLGSDHRPIVTELTLLP